MKTQPVATWLAAVVVALWAGATLWDRDFGHFLILRFVCAPVLVAVCLVLLFRVSVEQRMASKALPALMLALIVATSLANVEQVHDRIAFLFWYPTHRQQIKSFGTRDGIVMTWDSWGIAGMENDSYLVVNADDTISSIDAASKWARRYQPACPIAKVERMKRGLYIITTYNCPLI